MKFNFCNIEKITTYNHDAPRFVIPFYISYRLRFWVDEIPFTATWSEYSEAVEIFCSGSIVTVWLNFKKVSALNEYEVKGVIEKSFAENEALKYRLKVAKQSKQSILRENLCKNLFKDFEWS